LGDLRHHHLRMWAPFSSTPLKINCGSPITPDAPRQKRAASTSDCRLLY